MGRSIAPEPSPVRRPARGPAHTPPIMWIVAIALILVGLAAAIVSLIRV